MSVRRRETQRERFDTSRFIFRSLLDSGGRLRQLTWDGVGESVGVFGYECVLDVSSAHSVSTWKMQTHTHSKPVSSETIKG